MSGIKVHATFIPRDSGTRCTTQSFYHAAVQNSHLQCPRTVKSRWHVDMRNKQGDQFIAPKHTRNQTLKARYDPAHFPTVLRMSADAFGAVYIKDIRICNADTGMVKVTSRSYDSVRIFCVDGAMRKGGCKSVADTG